MPKRKVNVLLVASSLWMGGAEMVVRHLAETIDRSRFNVTVCHLKQRGIVGDQIASLGIDIVGAGGETPPKVDYFTALKLLRVIRDRRIAVVHTHMTHALVDAAVCKLLMPWLKLVHTFHFGNYPHTEKRVLGFEQVFSRVPTRLFAVGNQQRAQILKVFHFPDSRVTTIHNGVVPAGGHRDPDFRRRVGAEGRILIGTIGTMIEQKGLQDLLRVAARLRDSGQQVMFVVIGEGHLRPELERMRRELNLEDSVVFTGWVANAGDVALPTFDIFFQPSLWEAMSMVILEAMAAGKSIVATRVGENAEVIEDGATGLLVNPRDIDGMAAALTRLIRDPSLRATFGAAARTVFDARFTVAHMTRAYEQAYLDVTS